MKREIKFRVFDTEFNKYHWDQGDWSLGIKSGMVRGIYGEEFPEFIVEQYTGLKDKHGKEVYEGDILKSEQHENVNFTVRWTKGGFVVNTPVKKWEHDMYPFEALAGLQIKSWVEQTCEIIGNIHQTP